MTAINDNGVQIIDITDINNPIAASEVIDGQDNFEALGGARDIAITTIGSSTYALVTSQPDDGVQIIDITDPYNPIAASAVFDEQDGYDELDGADAIAITTLEDTIIAVVASTNDDGVQFINITDPYTPLPIHSVTTEDAGYSFDKPRDVVIRVVDGASYAFVLSTPGGPSTIHAMKIDFAVPITLESDNANPKYAKAGDTITLSISTNDDIASHSVDQIFTSTPNVILNGSHYSATLVVSEKPRETYAAFATTITSSTGETLSLDNSSVRMRNNVYVDTDAPRMYTCISRSQGFGASAIYITLMGYSGFKADTSVLRYTTRTLVQISTATIYIPAYESVVVYVYSTAEPSTLVSKVAFVIVVILPEYFGSPSVATAPGI